VGQSLGWDHRGKRPRGMRRCRDKDRYGENSGTDKRIVTTRLATLQAAVEKASSVCEGLAITPDANYKQSLKANP
jgi:hypothetical protein